MTRELTFNLLAAALYAVGAIMMKSSQGLRLLAPSLGIYACFGLGATLQALALQKLEVGAGNTIVLGVEAIASLALGVLVFREEVTIVKLAAVLLVASGVYLLRH